MVAEAKILASLNHPNIVKFICCGYDSEKTWHFIAMEPMEEDLRTVLGKRVQLKKGAPFPLLSAVDVVLQIAYGTCYLHEHGIGHRDLKTCNVVVRTFKTSNATINPYLKDFLQVKLVDFGLSKVKLIVNKSNTKTRQYIGTPRYMPPEAFAYGRADWFKADVYCFGIMCSVILSGQEPFHEIPVTQPRKVYEAVRIGHRPMLPPDTREELKSLIKRCWDTDRNVRPEFVEICTELAKFRHKLLREDLHGHSFNDEMDHMTYIQHMIKKQSDARKQDPSHVQSQLLGNVTEEDEWFDPNQDIIGDLDLTMNISPKTSPGNFIIDDNSVEKRLAGVVEVKIIRARNLIKKDSYVKIRLYSTESITRLTKSTRTKLGTFNPEWNETLNFKVQNPKLQLLQLKVLHWKKIGPHEVMGMHIIPVNDFQVEDERKLITLALLKNMDDFNDDANTKSLGDITFEMAFKPFKEEENEVHALEGTDPKFGGLLSVTIIQAEEVEGEYHTNPYVEVYFRGERKRTLIIKKNRNPRWDMEFTWDLADSPVNDLLHIEVRSEGSRIFNLKHRQERLGYVDIPLNDVVVNKRTNRTFQLVDSTQGKVQVELNWLSSNMFKTSPWLKRE